MKIWKKRAVLAAAAAVVLAGGVFLGWYWHYTTTPEYKARQLVAELRNEPPSRVRVWLTKIGLLKTRESRDSDEIVQDLAALGEVAIPALSRALKDEDADVRSRVVWALGKNRTGRQGGDTRSH